MQTLAHPVTRTDARRPRERATVAAGVLMTLLGGFWLVQGASMVALGLTLGTRSELNFRMVEVGMGREEGETLLVIAGVVVLAFAVAYLVATVGVAGRRAWARDAALFFSAVFGLVLLIASTAGLLSRPIEPDAPLALVGGLLNVAVFGLLVSRPFVRDLEAEEHRRRRESARESVRS